MTDLGILIYAIVKSLAIIAVIGYVFFRIFRAGFRFLGADLSDFTGQAVPNLALVLLGGFLFCLPWI